MIMGAFVAINAYASVWTMKIKVGEYHFVNSSIKYPRLFCHVCGAVERLEHHVKKDYGLDSRKFLLEMLCSIKTNHAHCNRLVIWQDILPQWDTLQLKS